MKCGSGSPLPSGPSPEIHFLFGWLGRKPKRALVVFENSDEALATPLTKCLSVTRAKVRERERERCINAAEREIERKELILT